MRKTIRLSCTLLCLGLLSFVSLVQSGFPQASAQTGFTLEFNIVPPAVEAGKATHPIGYVNLVSATGDPVLALRNLEVEIRTGDASIAFVPSRVTIPAGSDYARFNIEVSDFAGQTEISALYGNQIVTKTFKVVDAISLVEDVELVINLASNKMQVASEMPFSVYLENNGNILQAPHDIKVELDYEDSLVQLSSDSLVIRKGDYYAIGTVKTLEKSGNAFVRATSNLDGQLLTTVTNVEIAQTQPASLKVYVFPDKVSVNQKTIDIFVGVLDIAGQPTLAAEDIRLELFSSAYQLTGIGSVPAIIKKGEFGFYLRQQLNFYRGQEVIVGASASGLGASTATFEVLDGSLGPAHPKALDRTLKVFTVSNMPSDADSIVVYQLNAIAHDDYDVDCNGNGILTDDGTDCDGDGLFDTHRDTDGNGIIDERDWHPIDDLSEGELYPIDSISIYSVSQGNLNIVSGNNLAAKVVDPGHIASGSSYGTATLLSGRQANNVGISVSLSNFAVGSNTMTVVGGLNPVQSKIFSPGGKAPDGNYRVLFDRDGFTQLFFITLDSSGRPSNSERGVKYLVKPINELTEIAPRTSFAELRVKIDSFKANDVIAKNMIKEMSAVPVGVNSDSALQTTSKMHILFHTGTAIQMMLPFDSTVAFSKAHPIGIVQLSDQSGNPVLAPDDVTVRLSSSSLSSVLSVSSVTIPKGKSFTNFDITTFGRADNFTIYAIADGLQSSSAVLAPVVAELPASIIGSSSPVTSVPIEVMVSTPIKGASIAWGASAELQLLSNGTTFTPAGDFYTATMKVMSQTPGTFTVDATLMKDGFKPTRISKELVIGPYQRQMNVVLIDNGAAILAYNQPVLMKVSVLDASGMPVPGATVQVENSGAQGIVPVSTITTDAGGSATFVYMPANLGDSKFVTLMVTASKDGYVMSRDSKIFEIDSSSTVLPPLPLVNNALPGLPSWISYAIIGGVAAVGSGFYMLRTLKDPEDEESLIEEAGIVEDQTTEATEEYEETPEDEEEEE